MFRRKRSRLLVKCRNPCGGNRHGPGGFGNIFEMQKRRTNRRGVGCGVRFGDFSSNLSAGNGSAGGVVHDTFERVNPRRERARRKRNHKNMQKLRMARAAGFPRIFRGGREPKTVTLARHASADAQQSPTKCGHERMITRTESKLAIEERGRWREGNGSQAVCYLGFRGIQLLAGGNCMASAAQRRSDRVSLTLLLEASGKDINEQEFTVPARTMQINRDRGGDPAGSRPAARPAHSKFGGMAPPEAHRHTAGAHRGAIRAAERKVSSTAWRFWSTQSDIWNIEFPPIAESEEAVARMLLECTYCRSREVVYLNELELRGFETTRGIARLCKTCGVPSTWTQAPHENEKKLASRAARGKRARGSADADSPGGESSGNGQRLRMKTRLTACIRQANSRRRIGGVRGYFAGGHVFPEQKTV